MNTTDFDKWINDAAPGERIRYEYRDVNFDALNTKLMQHVFGYATYGILDLVQQREGGMVYYYAIKRGTVDPEPVLPICTGHVPGGPSRGHRGHRKPLQ